MKKILASILVAIIITATFILPVFASTVDLVATDIQINAATCAVPPVMDGKLDADSYQQINVTADQCSYNANDDTELAFLQTMPFKAYLSYDATNVYVLLSADATQYYYCDHAAGDEANIWNQSCCQISFSTGDGNSSPALEIGLARNSTDGTILPNIWSQAPDGTGDFDLTVASNHAVLLDGGTINYEVAVPWTEFLAAAPKVGDKFGLNFIVGYSNDGNRMYIEYSAGCGSGKDPSLFAKVTLTDTVLAAAPATTEAPATDAAAPATDAAAPAPAPAAPATTAPTTGDNTLAIFSVMVIAAAGVVIFRKKLLVK